MTRVPAEDGESGWRGDGRRASTGIAHGPNASCEGRGEDGERPELVIQVIHGTSSGAISRSEVGLFFPPFPHCSFPALYPISLQSESLTEKID